MGDSNAKKNKFKSFAKKFKFVKNKWFIIAAVSAVVIGVGVWWLVTNTSIWQNFGATKDSKLTTAKKKATDLDNKAGASPSKEVLSDTQDELADLADGASSKEEKQVYLLKSIQLYVNNKDFESALTVAKDLDDINPSALTAASIAMAYMGLADYQKAADYYQIAADRSEKTDDPTVRSPYNDYMILKRQAEALIK